MKHVGDTLATSWPTQAECGPLATLASGEEERSRREARWSVGFIGADKKHYDYAPSSEDEFERYETGSAWRLKVGMVHEVEVLPKR